MTSPKSMDIEAMLSSLSTDIWERLRDLSAIPPRVSVRFGEETITDILMLDLNRNAKTLGLYTQTPKPKEALRGTDFECWVGAESLGWIRLAIQAKKLDLRTNRYLNLKHRVGRELQIDRLDLYAAANDVVAMYCLYNYNDQLAKDDHAHCCQNFFEEEEFGCTITPSSTIRSAIKNWGQRSFDAIHKNERTVPWVCLARCPRVSGAITARKSQPPSNSESASIPFFDVVPRVYPALPGFLRERLLSQTTEGRNRTVEPDEFDIDMYSREVGRPSRISVMDLEGNG